MRAFIESTEFSRDGKQGLIQALKDKGFAITMGTPVPFTMDFKDPLPKWPHQIDVVFGSTGFVERCRHHDLPVFKSFPPNPWFVHLEPHYLNADGEEMTVEAAKGLEFPLFVKPYREKLFSGFVAQSWDELASVQTSCSCDILTERVQVSSPKRFGPECRLFYVDGEFVTGSWYKGRSGEVVDGPVVEFANKLVKAECPDEAFAIDLVQTAVGIKIVELNNFNCAGLYESDPKKIVDALYWLTTSDPLFS